MNERKDPLGVGADERKADQRRPPEEGPPVAQMATTYGSSLVTSEEQAERIATDAASDGDAPRDGLGRPQGPPQGTSQERDAQ